MKKLLILLILILNTHFAISQTATSLQSFALSDVRLLESPFLKAEQTDLQYILALDPDRLLAPYRIEAGLEPKAPRYGNWESSGLDGHIGGHYLTALSLMYASTGNEKVLERLEYMIDELYKCQQKIGTGYLGGIPNGQAMWEEIAAGNIKAASFSLNDRWVPLYNIHKLFAGLRDAYLVAGNVRAKQMLVDLSNWFLKLNANLTDAQIQKMLTSEQGGLNEVLADVAEITGDKRFLDLAKKYSHRQILKPLLEEEDHLTGLHANTQIPKVIGFERIAQVDGDSTWQQAADFFWNTVVENRTISIGGNSVREHFNPTDDFSSMVETNQGPETCNTYNMLKLSKLLFLAEGDAKYVDYYERAMYNHILSSQNPKGGFVYFTPIRPRHYRVYSQPQQDFWCCVGSGIENHAKYGTLIYAHNDQGLFVNMFIPSKLSWKEKGIKLTQQTKFPYEQQSELTLQLEAPKQFTLNIRHPAWVSGALAIEVNRKQEIISSEPSSYVAIDRKWNTGDKVTIKLPMHLSLENLPDNSPWVSFLYGPVVLAAATDSTDLKGLWADDGRMSHVASGKFYPIDKAPLIVAENDQEILSGIKPLDIKNLAFTAEQLIYPDKYRHLKLVPFYTIHEARYMLYWRVIDQEHLEKKLQEMHEEEQQMLALEASTVDQVATGEQQPETDHNFKGNETNNGINEGHYWRDASGWFSYELDNPQLKGKVLRLSYFGGDRNRTFGIFINDQLFKTVNLDDAHGSDFYTVDYNIPKDLQSTKMIIKFSAHKNSVAGGIYYIRLLRH